MKIIKLTFLSLSLTLSSIISASGDEKKETNTNEIPNEIINIQLTSNELFLFAVKNGYVDIAKQMDFKDININQRLEYNWTPVMYAIHNGHKEMVEFLLSNGAFLRVYDVIGLTPITIAVLKNQKEILKVLLKSKATSLDFIIFKTKTGKTALDLAKEKGYIEIVELLKNKLKDIVNQILEIINQ